MHMPTSCGGARAKEKKPWACSRTDCRLPVYSSSVPCPPPPSPTHPPSRAPLPPTPIPPALPTCPFSGRKRASLLYVVTYSLSCLTKHSGRFWVLMGGRLLGGVSTSLLFSAFESWLVAEHNKRGFPSAVLGDVFSKAVFLGAGLMAIVSGLLGNVLVETLRLGPVAPFDAAIGVMLVGAAVIVHTWTENYGDNAHHSLLLLLLHMGRAESGVRRAPGGPPV